MGEKGVCSSYPRERHHVLPRAAQVVAQVDASCLSEAGHRRARLRVERVEILPDSDEQTLVPPASDQNVSPRLRILPITLHPWLWSNRRHRPSDASACVRAGATR
jgi:hypothetical protein